MPSLYSALRLLGAFLCRKRQDGYFSIAKVVKGSCKSLLSSSTEAQPSVRELLSQWWRGCAQYPSVDCTALPVTVLLKEGPACSDDCATADPLSVHSAVRGQLIRTQEATHFFLCLPASFNARPSGNYDGNIVQYCSSCYNAGGDGGGLKSFAEADGDDAPFS